MNVWCHFSPLTSFWGPLGFVVQVMHECTLSGLLMKESSSVRASVQCSDIVLLVLWNRSHFIVEEMLLAWMWIFGQEQNSMWLLGWIWTQWTHSRLAVTRSYLYSLCYSTRLAWWKSVLDYGIKLAQRLLEGCFLNVIFLGEEMSWFPTGDQNSKEHWKWPIIKC